MAGNLTIDALLTEGVNRLQGAGNRTADDVSTHTLDTELLLAHILGKNRTYLKAHPEQTPTPEQARRYTAFIDRRAAGEPVAYIVGYRDFWTLRLAVNPAVLVPRPETELLVERALALGPAGPASVADLGTGSGAIALALASERPQWSVTAVDISANALSIARENAATLGLTRVEFLKGAWFVPLRNRQFDVIASNPPYVSETDTALKGATLQHEPQIALASGPDGLSAIREIVSAAPDHLKRHGWLLLEHGSDQATEVAHELVARGFGHVRSHRDLAGHWRLTEAQWVAPHEDTLK
ncbi:MAG: peptide chain release factor N(5)-glutamine methyltransferase [Proteobacteria bacterium]|nr:peptide chain release factor N(5)-glutamine methyltransferase [Pseudomonadota bacterium]